MITHKPLMMLVILSGIFLSGCQSLEHRAEQCSTYHVYTDETKKLLDVDKSTCFCREYEFSESYVGPISGSGKDMPFSYCNKVVGFKDYAKTATFWQSVRLAITEAKINLFISENE